MNTPLWFSNLLFWSVQVALIMLAAAFLPGLLRIRQPRVLLAYWRSLIAIALLLPVIQPWRQIQSFAEIELSPEVAPAHVSATPVPAAAPWYLRNLELVVQILGFLILAGIVLRFAILALGLLRLRRLRRFSSPISAQSGSSVLLQKMLTHVNTRAEFRLSADVDSPVTFGFMSPIILLPECFPSMDTRFQSAIACHELLHARRRDWAHHLLEEVIRAVLWFHPAILWLISRARLAREQVVDLEVVKLTNARKPYLEALLAFTNSRASISAVPAPPFIAERQLAERVALMLKEVRMSRRRLIASLTSIVCFLALTAAVAVWAFPLKAAPAPPDSARQNSSSRQPEAFILQRIEVRHHGFSDAVLKNTVVNAEEARTRQLADRPTIETLYNQTKVDHMEKAIEAFWNERGIVVEVRTSLTPSPLSPRYAMLQFDVYKQTALSGTLKGGISGGVTGGVAGGISGSVRGGISGAAEESGSRDIPTVDNSTIWTDTVKRGPMIRQVRGLGTLAHVENSANLIAKITLPESLTKEIHASQHAMVATEKGPFAAGHVVSVGREVVNGAVTVEISTDEVPRSFISGDTAPLQIEASIDIEKIDDVLHVGRPAQSAGNSSFSIFKIVNDGTEAERVTVKFGRVSVTTIEVLDGLKEGDKVILSDMSSYDNADRIRLK